MATDDEENMCSVCMGEFRDKTGVFYINIDKPIRVCEHTFCQECIVEWCRNSTKTCPLCRRSLIYCNNTPPSTDEETNNEDIYIDP